MCIYIYTYLVYVYIYIYDIPIIFHLLISQAHTAFPLRASHPKRRNLRSGTAALGQRPGPDISGIMEIIHLVDFCSDFSGDFQILVVISGGWFIVFFFFCSSKES